MKTSEDPNQTPGALATLGHELKTPLAAIVGYADAMRSRALGPLDGAYADAAESIHAAAGHMVLLIDRLIGLGVLEDGERRLTFERFDARDALNGARRLFDNQAQTLGVEIAVAAPEGAMIVDADALAFKEILINLIANALTAGGRRVTATLSREGADLIVTVADDGRGLHGAGEGLGLRLVRRLAAAHGGEFTLEGVAAGGAIARLRLPIAAAT